jgi:hypothetical protein
MVEDSTEIGFLFFINSIIIETYVDKIRKICKTGGNFESIVIIHQKEGFFPISKKNHAGETLISEVVLFSYCVSFHFLFYKRRTDQLQNIMNCSASNNISFNLLLFLCGRSKILKIKPFFTTFHHAKFQSHAD